MGKKWEQATYIFQEHLMLELSLVVLGEQKFVSTEAPRAITGLACIQCKAAIDNIRSFKCHNWAYAIGILRKVVQQMPRTSSVRSSKWR